MSHTVVLDEFMKATLEATSEFASTTLGEPMHLSEPGSDMAPDLTGCFVALVGDEGSLQIGLATNPEGCQKLAQALFASDVELPAEDVSDALGEIANIIAGGVKCRMATPQLALALGLPIVMEGRLRLAERQQIVTADVRLGQVPVRLLILGNKERRQPA